MKEYERKRNMDNLVIFYLNLVDSFPSAKNLNFFIFPLQSFHQFLLFEPNKSISIL